MKQKAPSTAAAKAWTLRISHIYMPYAWFLVFNVNGKDHSGTAVGFSRDKTLLGPQPRFGGKLLTI